MSGLSEREWSDVLATLPEDPETADGWELSLVRRTVDRVLSERVTAALTEAVEAIEAELREAPNPSRQLRMWTNTHAAIVRGLIPTDSAIAGAP